MKSLPINMTTNRNNAMASSASSPPRSQLTTREVVGILLGKALKEGVNMKSLNAQLDKCKHTLNTSNGYMHATVEWKEWTLNKALWMTYCK